MTSHTTSYWQYWLKSITLVCAVVWAACSCTPQDEVVTPDAGALLSFDADTVMFDTVFTEVGSVTKRLKVYNPNDKAVRISEIKVGGLGASQFQVIVNGQPGPALQNVELRGKDSLLVLVKATINPNSENLPFLVDDSIQFLTNGNQQKVHLRAYGQNAHYYRNGYVTSCAEVWDTDKAHVIYDTVTVPENCTLTIKKGVQVYVQNNVKLKVLGTLIVEGEHENRVGFQQIRQEERYRNAPAQWVGLEFGPSSHNNVLRYVDIKNAVNGIIIRAEGNQLPDVKVQHAFIRNMLQAGVFSLGGNVDLINSIITNCGQYAFAGAGGGTYRILYSTLANYSYDFIRTTPSVIFYEELALNEVSVRHQPYFVTITNSIIWGRQEEEMQFEPSSLGSTIAITYSFLKTKEYAEVFNAAELHNHLNEDPKFRDAPAYDFQIIKLSPANGAGTPLPAVTTIDYQNKDRDPIKPDVGAVEVHD
ncbi:hypothetical protein [Rufibacter roseus]|uniref:Right-handed parallel beta-helix repeat-containing protein n=1 Tax=Rufibacter roseus TaxID=1567108 RepID=A0ABW2DIM5_9BACT|nr:hypothetical protein [Rufibacter roseus]